MYIVYYKEIVEKDRWLTGIKADNEEEAIKIIKEKINNIKIVDVKEQL